MCELKDLQIRKRDGRLVKFRKDKIVNAALAAFKDVDGSVDEYALDKSDKIADYIAEKAVENPSKILDIEDIQNMVENGLANTKRKDVAFAFHDYRVKRTNARKNTIDDEVMEIVDATNDYWDSENANKNPRINSTQRDYMAGSISTDLTKRYLLSDDIVKADKEGILHFHDKDYFAQREHNCDLINLDDMLQNGTAISETLIERPKSFTTACTVATQIIAQVASNQYGGQSISLEHLAPFIDVSRKKLIKKEKEDLDAAGIKYTEDQIKTIVERKVKEIVKDGAQTIQYQLITFQTTNGQAPFITIFMYLNEARDEQTKKDLAMLIEEMLKQRIQGVKNREGHWIAPAFPKLIYVLEDDNCDESQPYWYLTQLAAECSSKRLVPDYISEKKMVELKGDVYTCMGCVDGQEIITYKFQNKLYVESFERMWNRLSMSFTPYSQSKIAQNYDPSNLYMDLSNVQIFDSGICGFTECKRIIRNISNKWIDINFSNGRRILCTEDHPFEVLGKGIVQAKDLSLDDQLIANYGQYSENNYVIDPEYAWTLGFIICDGCYSGGSILASIAEHGEDEIEVRYKNNLKKFFNVNTKTKVQHRGLKGNYKDINSTSQRSGEVPALKNTLTNLFEGINKINRHIPNEVFEWNYEAKLAFIAGLIDADGYINNTSNIKYGKNMEAVVQLGSTNKEFALQQLALAQSVGMPAKLYYNHYSSKDYSKIRYRIEFIPSYALIQFIACAKKVNNSIINPFTFNFDFNNIISVSDKAFIENPAYSYDVTTQSEHFDVSGIWSHNCRSFLTPDNPNTKEGLCNKGNKANAKNYKEGDHKYYGRFNQGVVTINLPDIAFSSGRDEEKFWKIFDERAELCHKALQFRHKRLMGTSTQVAPILWQDGALARLSKDETIDKLLVDNYSTISLGFCGLYECVKYMTGHSHSDEGIGKAFGIKVMKALNDKCSKWREAEHVSYSLYGTPMESTTYKLATCLKERFGKDIFVKLDGKDRNYITNSYHIPVFEEIDAFDKLKIESEFQELAPGGAISYIETPDMTHNIPALLEVIKYMYQNIMYAEINTKNCYCEKCGYDGNIPIVKDTHGKLIWKCPNCGNEDSTKMDIAFRVCGYIGTAKNGANQGRMGDIHDRVYHIDDKEFRP